MRIRSNRIFSSATLPLFLAGCAGAAADPGTVTTGSVEPVGQAEEALTLGFTPVPNANTKTPGFSSANALPPELIEAAVAQGSIPLENPRSVTKPDGTVVNIGFYGYISDGPML